jgi:hypothetical protein
MKVTKRSTFTGDFDVSEQQAEPISGEPGSVGTGPAAPHSSDAQGESVAASMQGPSEASIEGSTRVDSPKLAPEQGAAEEMPKVDPPKVLADKVLADMVLADKAETSKAETSKAETSKAEIPAADAPRIPGRVMIMSAGDRSWDSNDAGPAPESEPTSGMFGKRRLGALAAVVALAAVAGALGGAVATASLGHFGGDNTASVANHGLDNHALEASVARLDADIQALKVGADHASKLGMTQFNKTSERLDKVEKAQLEPAAKLARLSEAVEKLHATPPVAAAAAAPAAARETTGSISPPTTAPATAPKAEVARLPTVEGWTLRDVINGSALIEGRQGIFEVYAGDPVPGLGRIDAIRRQDGHWVVVTSKGLIVAR